tara:strand:+ start:5110 stop:5268 length:159 start_codon:yes stop_codon:yes gene_type:complete
MSNKQLEIFDKVMEAAKKIVEREVMDDFDAGYSLAFTQLLAEFNEESTPLTT